MVIPKLEGVSGVAQFGRVPPTIVFVVPTLDSHQLMQGLVTSLKSQTWAHWEVLIIDGGSGPEHIAWLKELCAGDARFGWQSQDPELPGIFGAFNQGFDIVARSSRWQEAWILFWGSDDWAASPDVMAHVARAIEAHSSDEKEAPDLLIARARYARIGSKGSIELGRRSVFTSLGSYRRSVFFGPTPPHQGTVFGPKVRQRQPRFARGFMLSADVDYFLRLSRFQDLRVELLDFELVHMSDAGISGQKNARRFAEVKWAYKRRYGGIWWLGYLFRYFRRGFDMVLGAF